MVFSRSRSTTVSSALMATALLGACQNSAPDASRPEQSPSPSDKATLELPQPTGPSSTSGLADIPHSEQRLCRFEVDGKVLVNGKCEVFPMGDGGYTLNTWTAGKPTNSHFAVVITKDDGSAEASWNADPDNDKAMDPLGIVTLQQDCWVNEHARICAR